MLQYINNSSPKTTLITIWTSNATVKAIPTTPVNETSAGGEEIKATGKKMDLALTLGLSCYSVYIALLRGYTSECYGFLFIQIASLISKILLKPRRNRYTKLEYSMGTVIQDSPYDPCKCLRDANDDGMVVGLNSLPLLFMSLLLSSGGSNGEQPDSTIVSLSDMRWRVIIIVSEQLFPSSLHEILSLSYLKFHPKHVICCSGFPSLPVPPLSCTTTRNLFLWR